MNLLNCLQGLNYRPLFPFQFDNYSMGFVVFQNFVYFLRAPVLKTNYSYGKSLFYFQIHNESIMNAKIKYKLSKHVQFESHVYVLL